MATEVKFRKGTTAQSNAFTGAFAEITVDTTKQTLRVHDAVTAGGSELVNLNAEQTLDNKTLNDLLLTGTLTANSSTGSSGQYLESTGTGVQWSNIDTSSISNGTSNITVSENANVTVTVGDSLSATFSSTGLVLAGNLTVNGTTTTINSTTLTVDDLNVVVASGAADAAAANGSGLTVDGANANLTYASSGDKWTINKPLDAGTNSVALASITKNGTDGVGNIGSSSNTFNTVFAKATSAEYADLAEMYAADKEYEPSTVVIFGGSAEVTESTEADDRRVAGVVSTNPSYLMNSNQTGDHVAAIALQGRVPCRVVGAVRKGDLMVSAGNGAAKVNNNPSIGTVIGKALEDLDGESGVIEVVVGRV